MPTLSQSTKLLPGSQSIQKVYRNCWKAFSMSTAFIVGLMLLRSIRLTPGWHHTLCITRLHICNSSCKSGTDFYFFFHAHYKSDIPGRPGLCKFSTELIHLWRLHVWIFRYAVAVSSAELWGTQKHRGNLHSPVNLSVLEFHDELRPQSGLNGKCLKGHSLGFQTMWSGSALQGDKSARKNTFSLTQDKVKRLGTLLHLSILSDHCHGDFMASCCSKITKN